MPFNPALWSESFSGGYGLGLATRRQDREEANSQSALELARNRADREDSNTAWSQQHGDAELQLRRDELNQRTGNVNADRQAMTNAYDQAVTRPSLNAAYDNTDWSDGGTNLIDAASTLQQARGSFAQADPTTQRSILNPTLQGQREQGRIAMVADIKKKSDEEKFRRRLTGIIASDLPEQMKERLVARLTTEMPVPLEEKTPLTVAEWKKLPLRGGMDDATGQLADLHVQATGKMPPEYMLKPTMDRLSGVTGKQDFSPHKNPQMGTAMVGVQRAKSYVDSATLKYRAAIQAYNGARAAQRDGKVIDDAEMTAYEAKVTDAEGLLKQAQDRLDAAYSGVQGVYGGPAGAPGAKGKAHDLPSAVQQAWQQLGEDADPSDVADLAEKMMGGGQQDENDEPEE